MKNAEQFQILTNHCKMADSRVEPEGEGGNIDEVWEGREISGIVWTKMMAIVMMMNITAVRVMMIFQRILEGRRACLSTGGSETTCPNDSKSCQFTVIIMNSQWISSICVKKNYFTTADSAKSPKRLHALFLKVRIGTRNYIFTPGHGDMDELRVSNTYFSHSKSMSHTNTISWELENWQWTFWKVTSRGCGGSAGEGYIDRYLGQLLNMSKQNFSL